MRLNLHTGLAAGLLLATAIFAAPLEITEDEASLEKRQSSCNTATNRQCWTSSPAFSVSTDTETSWPNTGVTVPYTFTLTEVDNWIGGDGVAKQKAMLINGQFPGPTITANWGDKISVTVINNLVTNGTSIHWHGLRQLNSNIMDGSSGITECPIPPGSSKTYTFQATQYGTAWYHSHFSSQYGNGVLGPIVINGPATANYDIDLGPLSISDWYYQGADAIAVRISNPATPGIPGFQGSPPPSDNVLFNGKNINPRGSGGSYQVVTLTPGKTHLMRLINPSVDDTFTVSIVGHPMAIVAADLVPVTPQTVTSLYMAVGQRYDVLINANQTVGNYWMNVTYSSGPCGLSNNPRPAAIIRYSGAATSNPTSPGTAPPDSHCADLQNFSPYVAKTAPVSGFTPNSGDTLNVKLDINQQAARVFWPINNSPMNVSWNNPTLQYVKNGNTGSMPSTENVISIPTGNIWSYWLIQNNSPIPHPMHLHGHDILILGQSTALANPLAPGQSARTYNDASDRSSLKTTNQPRRDTTMLPAYGWLVLAFKTNNAGAWLFHCHVAFHVGEGMSIQYLEQLSAIPTTNDLSVLAPTCAAWNSYYPAHDPFWQTDSGI